MLTTHASDTSLGVHPWSEKRILMLVALIWLAWNRFRVREAEAAVERVKVLEEELDEMRNFEIKYRKVDTRLKQVSYVVVFEHSEQNFQKYTVENGKIIESSTLYIVLS